MTKEEILAQRETGSLEVQAGNYRATFRGVDTKLLLLALLIVVCFAVIAYGWREDRMSAADTRTAFLHQHEITQKLLTTVIANQEVTNRIIESAQKENASTIVDMTYVLTLSQAKREALHLEMPQSLRKRVNER